MVLIDRVTVREHLELFAAIKGIPSKEREEIVEDKIKEMGLSKYEN